MKTLRLWQMAVIAVVIAGLGGGSYTAYNKVVGPSSPSLPSNIQLATARTGNILSTVTASGSVSFPSSAQLTFGSAGTVQEINVKAGDRVQKGQALARLDNTSLITLKKAVAQAKINLQNAQDDLDLAQNPASQQVNVAQADVAVANARVSLQTAQENLSAVLNPDTDLQRAQAKAAVANAKVTLETARDNLASIKAPYTEAQITAAEATIEQAQQKLSNVQTQAPLDIADAQDAAVKAYNSYTSTIERYYLNPGRLSPSDLDAAKRAWTRAELSLVVVQQNADKSIADAQNNLEKAQQTLADMKAAPDPLKVEQAQKQVDLAQANLIEAEKNLSDIKTSPDPLKVEQARKQIDLAQANLASTEEAVAKAKTADALNVELKKVQVEAAQAALDDAQDKLNKATMAAPFSGIVTAVNIQSGQTVNANTAAIDIVDDSAVEVSAIVSEIDVPQVKQGQKATVNLDSLPGVELTGTVSAVSTVGRSQSGVVSYPVTIALIPPSGVQLRAGMSAVADIVTQEANNVLLVPNQAIRGSTTNPTVMLMVDGQTQAKQVKLGASDGQYTAVTEGLKQGDQVAITVTASSSGSSGTNRFFQGGGILGGGGGGLPGGIVTFGR